MKLSIITVNRNNVDGLRKTIESVVSQTFTDFEYIIIDGASTDGSVEVIKEYAKATLPNGEGLGERLYWVSEPDTGIYNAMNKGILKAKGEYLQFLNSGDWLTNNDVLKYVFDLRRNEDVLYGDEFLFYNINKIVRKVYPQKLTFYDLFVGSISHEGSFYKKYLFDKLYDETLKIASDWEFEIREIILANRSTYKIPKEIIYFDMTGISQSIEHQDIQLEERNIVLEKFIPERIMLDYYQIQKHKEITHYSLYPYVEIFAKHPRLQQIVRRFMKLLLFTVRKKNS